MNITLILLMLGFSLKLMKIYFISMDVLPIINRICHPCKIEWLREFWLSNPCFSSTKCSLGTCLSQRLCGEWWIPPGLCICVPVPRSHIIMYVSETTEVQTIHLLWSPAHIIVSSYSVVSEVWKHKRDNCRNKQFLSLRLYSVLSSI